MSSRQEPWRPSNQARNDPIHRTKRRGLRPKEPPPTPQPSNHCSLKQLFLPNWWLGWTGSQGNSHGSQNAEATHQREGREGDYLTAQSGRAWNPAPRLRWGYTSHNSPVPATPVRKRPSPSLYGTCRLHFPKSQRRTQPEFPPSSAGSTWATSELLDYSSHKSLGDKVHIAEFLGSKVVSYWGLVLPSPESVSKNYCMLFKLLFVLSLLEQQT